MTSNCDIMKDQVADLITGSLPAEELETLRQHLCECSVCRDYAERLREEDELLSELFTKFDADMAGREGKAIGAIMQADTPGRINVISIGKAIIDGVFAKHAAAAAIIFFVTLYFIITMTWISQINECIRLCL